MPKSKNKKNIRPKSKLFQIIVGIVLIAFIGLMLSDLLTKKTKTPAKLKTDSKEIYKFKKQGELSFQSVEGDYISSIDVEFADNEYERTQGLMYRTQMKENQSMLFIFPFESRQSFFMKNTVISLDMIFINSDLEIVTIHKNTEPYTQNSYASTAPAQYVLETIAGYTDKYNIDIGGKIIFRKSN